MFEACVVSIQIDVYNILLINHFMVNGHEYCWIIMSLLLKHPKLLYFSLPSYIICGTFFLIYLFQMNNEFRSSWLISQTDFPHFPLKCTVFCGTIDVMICALFTKAISCNCVTNIQKLNTNCTIN